MNSLDLPRRPEDTRVVVAMSGGVDSSVVAGLMNGERTQDVADKVGVSAARVSQLRRELHASWRAFGADAPARPC